MAGAVQRLSISEAGILGGFKSLELGFLLRLIGELFDISSSTRGSVLIRIRST